MIAGRYLGAALRVLAWSLLTTGVGLVASGLGFVVEVDVGDGRQLRLVAFMAIGGALLIVLAVFLLRQWRWMLARLPRVPGRLELGRGAARAGLLGGVAAYALFASLAQGARAFFHPVADDLAPHHELVYMHVIHAAVFLGALRAAFVGVRVNAREDADAVVITPRALEATARLILGLWVLVCVVAGGVDAIVGVVTSGAPLHSGALLWGLPYVGAMGALGFVLVRGVWQARGRGGIPIRLACAATGLMLLLSMSQNGAYGLAEALHGRLLTHWPLVFPQGPMEAVSLGVQTLHTGPGLLLAFAGAIGLLLYARFGRPQGRLLEAFE